MWKKRERMNNMKVIFMGTPDYAVGALQAIVDAGYEVTAVVTQPDKPKGRGKEMQMPPVKECAIKNHIPVFPLHLPQWRLHERLSPLHSPP